MLISSAKFLIVAVAAGVLLWSAGQAAADYPPPVGSLSGAASDTAPAPGDDVTVTCTVLDNSGGPMASEPCTFTITSQPGGASFDGSPSTVKNTDQDGVATAVLSSGATPGSIVVSIQSGAMSSQVTVTTAEGAVQLPDTGDAPSGSDSPSWPLAAGAAAAGLALVLAGGFVALKTRRDHA